MSQKRSNTLPYLLLAVLLVLAIAAVRRSEPLSSAGDGPPSADALTGLLAENEPTPNAEPDNDNAAPQAPAPTEANFNAAASIVVEGLPAVHLLRAPFDDNRSAMAWTNYLAALDIERMYFTQEDLAIFEPHRLHIAEEARFGNISFAEEAHDLFMRRVRERVASIQEILAANDFDFSVDESYAWRRRDSQWPKDPAEQDDLWRRRIKNEVLARIVAKEIDEEEAAKKKAENPETPEPENPETPEPDNQETQEPESSETPEPESPDPENAEPEHPDSENAEPESPSAQTPQSPDPATSPAPETPTEFLSKRYAKFLSFMEDSDSEYYLSRFMTAICTAYDPHSDYLSPVSQEDFDINMQLSLQGIGATLQTEDGTAKISEIIPGGPADRDTRDIRLVPGDRIVAVAQGDEEFVDILHWPLYKAVRLIRGKKGTRVRLLVQCADDPTHVKTKTVELVRDEVKLEEQAATSNVETFTDEAGRERKMGVVTLPTFYAGGGRDGTTQRSCSADIARLLGDLNAQGVEGLILDLRGNGGGALKEAVDLVGLFIRSGPVVLVREPRGTTALKDFNPAISFQKPMIVLVDRLSASASEIVAGALQDYGRAVIVGDSHTHGKGTVQQIMPLGGGPLGSLKATNAGFYRITGDSTQLRGVASDIILPSAFDFYSELGEDKLPNAIPWTQIRGVSYQPVANVVADIPALREKSELRRATDERWQRHLRRLVAVKRINAMEAVPLEIEKRRTLAHEERELLKDEDTAAMSGSSALDDDNSSRPKSRAERAAERRANDVVLDEGLRILGDLVDQNAQKAPEPEPAAPSINDIFRSFFP